jgi:hypothetical protein
LEKGTEFLGFWKRFIEKQNNNRNKLKATNKNLCEISSSHGGEYEAQNLLGCTAVFLIECRPDVSEVRAASIIRTIKRQSTFN